MVVFRQKSLKTKGWHKVKMASFWTFLNLSVNNKKGDIAGPNPDLV
jgi:hypothetical protein